MTQELPSREILEAKAAKLLSTWTSLPRKDLPEKSRNRVSVSEMEYDLFFTTLRPLRVIVVKDSNPIQYISIVLDKQKAMARLQQEYQMHDVRRIR